MMVPTQSSSSAAVFIHWLGKVKAWFSPHWLCDQLLHTMLVYQCFRFRVTIVPWRDIFYRPHWYKLCILLLTDFFSLYPSILRYKITDIATTLYSHYSTLAFSQPEISTHTDYISNLRVKPEKHVGFLIVHPSISISSILLYTVPSNLTRMWHTLGATSTTKSYLHSLLFLRRWMCLDCIILPVAFNTPFKLGCLTLPHESCVCLCSLSLAIQKLSSLKDVTLSTELFCNLKALQFKGSPPTGMIEPTSQHT